MSDPTDPQVEHLLESIIKTDKKLIELGLPEHMSIKNETSYDKIVNEFAERRSISEVSDQLKKFGHLFKPGDLILDVGCGSGVPISKYLFNLGLKVTGIDISSKLLARAQKNVPGGIFLKKDIANFHPNTHFQGIIAWDSLFHLEPQEHEPVFNKLYEILDTKGYLLFTHGGSAGSISGDMFGQRFTYSSPGPRKLKDMLKNIGFMIVDWELDLTKPNGYLIALVKKIQLDGSGRLLV